MGMSASQARYLALIARMNDVEYQGQQINQQRTTLSNQINDLYNTLLEMDVPTPPSTQDFTKVQYSGTSNASKFTLGTVKPTGQNPTTGENTYSVDINYQMSGHSVEQGKNTAQLKNTSQYLGYKTANINGLLKKNTVESVKLGSEVSTISKNPSAAEVNQDVLVKLSVAEYNAIKGSYPNNTIYAASETAGEYDECQPNALPSSGTIYFRCNIADIMDNNTLKAATGYDAGVEGENIPVSNISNVGETSQKTITTDEISAIATDEVIKNSGIYIVDNPNNQGSIPRQITTKEALQEAIANGYTIVQRDYSSTPEIKFTNPNYNANNSTGLSVGEYPVEELNSDEIKAQLSAGYDEYITALRNSFPEYSSMTDEQIADQFYVYIEHSQSGTDIPHFIRKSEMSAINNADTTSIKTYEYDEDGTYTQTENKKDCQLEFDTSTGRITKIGIPDGKGQITWIDLKAETVTDDAAYQDAFNDYEYKKALYDKQQEDINRKTAIIQQEDKNLELKLTRLDNERNALNTELEAVKKVISDNIDKSYKTFSG